MAALNSGNEDYSNDVLDTVGSPLESSSTKTNASRANSAAKAIVAIETKLGVALDGDMVSLVSRLAVSIDSYGLLQEGCNQFVKDTEVAVSAAMSTNIPFDDTSPDIAEGDEVFSRSFTPKSATSILEIAVDLFLSAGGAEHIIAALFNDSSNVAVGCEYVSAADKIVLVRIRYHVVSGSVSARTYSVRVGSASQDVVLNGIVTGPARMFGGTLVSSMTIREMQN